MTMDNKSLRVYRDTFRVRYRDTGRNGKLKLAGWFDALQEAAADHAERLGFGFDAMLAARRHWVLNRLRLEILREPVSGETLEIETWPSAPERLFARREFRVNIAGELVGRASSRWAVIDAVTLRPRRLEELAEAMPDNSDRKVWSDFPDRLPDAPDDGEGFTVPVRYTLEDVNGHMNNAEYAGLVQDWLVEKSAGMVVPLRDVEIFWRAALRAPETVTISGVHSSTTGDFHLSGRNGSGGVVFSARGRLVPHNPAMTSEEGGQ